MRRVADEDVGGIHDVPNVILLDISCELVRTFSTHELNQGCFFPVRVVKRHLLSLIELNVGALA